MYSLARENCYRECSSLHSIFDSKDHNQWKVMSIKSCISMCLVLVMVVSMTLDSLASGLPEHLKVTVVYVESGREQRILYLNHGVPSGAKRWRPVMVNVRDQPAETNLLCIASEYKYPSPTDIHIPLVTSQVGQYQLIIDTYFKHGFKTTNCYTVNRYRISTTQSIQTVTNGFWLVPKWDWSIPRQAPGATAGIGIDIAEDSTYKVVYYWWSRITIDNSRSDHTEDIVFPYTYLTPTNTYGTVYITNRVSPEQILQFEPDLKLIAEKTGSKTPFAFIGTAANYFRYRVTD